MDAYLMMLRIFVRPVSRHESVARMVEHVKKTLVKWQARTEDSAQHHLVHGHVHL